MKLKKGQGLPLNVIIIAVIALIVLVVIIAIFSGKLRGFGKGATDCATRQGECEDLAECPEGSIYIPQTNCEAEDEICCAEGYT